jgi:hypothetical protein
MNQRPMTIYNILPEFGEAYGWIKRDGLITRYVGPCVACFGSWGGDHPISQELEERFSKWQATFEREVSVWGNDEKFDWQTFHKIGLELCIQLKQEIGEAARIIYIKPSEDPNCEVENRREIFADGSYSIIEPLE